jgi:hypothetical protein
MPPPIRTLRGSFTTNFGDMKMACILNTPCGSMAASCIDLTDKMDEFVDLVRAIGQNRVDVTVDYGRGGTPNHRLR